MSISVQCPGCEKKLKVKDELAGKRVKCPNCAQVVVVPSVRSASLQSTAPNPSPSKSPLRRGSEATASSATQSRPARWPWYAGGGAAFLCVLAVVISIFAMPGKNRTPAKNEMAAVTPPESKPEPTPKPEPKPEPKPPEEKPEKLLAVASKDWKKDFGAFIDVLSPMFKRDPLHSELNEKFEGQQVIWTGQFTQISVNGESKVVWLKMPAKTVTLSNGAKAEVYTLFLVPKENNLKKWEDAKVGDTVHFKTTLKGDSNTPAVYIGQYLDGVNAGKYHILILTDDAELVQAELPNANAKAEAATINAELAKAKTEMAKADEPSRAADDPKETKPVAKEAPKPKQMEKPAQIEHTVEIKDVKVVKKSPMTFSAVFAVGERVKYTKYAIAGKVFTPDTPESFVAFMNQESGDPKMENQQNGVFNNGTGAIFFRSSSKEQLPAEYEFGFGQGVTAKGMLIVEVQVFAFDGVKWLSATKVFRKVISAD